eukprot:scpid89587/ scgid16815/ 
MRVWAWRQRSESSRRYSRVYTTSMQPGEKPVSVRSRLCTAYSRHILLSNTVDHGRWTTMPSPAAVMSAGKTTALKTDVMQLNSWLILKLNKVSFCILSSQLIQTQVLSNCIFFRLIPQAMRKGFLQFS